MSQDTSIEDREAEASRRLAAAIEPSTIYALLADAKRTGTPIEGVDGLLNQIRPTAARHCCPGCD